MYANSTYIHRIVDFSSNRTTVNRLTSELNRVIRELGLERDVLVDFQTKLDAAE